MTEKQIMWKISGVMCAILAVIAVIIALCVSLIMSGNGYFIIVALILLALYANYKANPKS